MKFGLIGDSYTARSTSIADEECINLYVETKPSDGTKSAIYTPGLDLFAALPQSPTRGSYSAGNRLFAVAGAGLYEITSAGTFSLIGTVANDGNAVSMASNGLQLLIVSGGRAYCLTLATLALLDVTAQLAAIPMQVQYSDTYFVVAFKNSNLFQVSDILDGTSWPGIQVNGVSVFSENIASIIVNHRELWVFGTRHTQPYQDTGSTEVFDVGSAPFIETGSAATMGPCLLDNSIFWVSEDDRGGRMAWRSNGYTPSRISTHAVEIDLASYPTIAGMTTYAYQDGGHLFWVLYIPGSQWSWVFDVSESMWHKRAAWVDGQWTAHLSWNHAYAFGLHLVGDWNSGNIYAMSQNAFTDNGAAIRRMRRTPTLGNEMQWITHSEMVLDFEMGNLSTVAPSDKPAFAASLYGPKPGTIAADTATGGAVWANPGHALLNNGTYASAALPVILNSNASSISTGTSVGGGVAWSNPENIDSAVSSATLFLHGGGTQIFSPDSGSAVNSANSSNQHPADVSVVVGRMPNFPATDATLYVPLIGSVVASSGGTGLLSLYYSQDSGSTWQFAGSNNASFPQVPISIPLSGLTNLNTIQIKLVAACSCGPTGFSNVSLALTNSSFYVVPVDAAQHTGQTLVAAVSGLTVPNGAVIRGLGLSFIGDIGSAMTLQVGLSVSTAQEPITVTSGPITYEAGGSSSLWGYGAWDASTLASLKVNFSSSSTADEIMSLSALVVTVYYTVTSSSDELDITKFGFTVPDTATPKGITPVVLAYADVAGGTLSAQLLQGGAPVGATETLPLSTAPSLLTFGGIADLFQAAWQDIDLRADGFGLRLVASTDSGASIQVFVGYSTLEIYAPAAIQSQIYIGPDPALVDGAGNPRAPQVMVRWSDDRGKSWSNEHVIDCGKLGEYTKRARLSRLGRSRYRVYEITMSDPLPWVVIEGYLKASQ